MKKQTPNRVLVIEEDEVSRDTIGVILSEEGYEVETVESGQRGLLRIDQFRPDLILCDVGGADVLATIRRDYPEIPVTLFTEETIVDAERNARQLGVSDYLNKPINLVDLLQSVARHLPPRGR